MDSVFTSALPQNTTQYGTPGSQARSMLSQPVPVPALSTDSETISQFHFLAWSGQGYGLALTQLSFYYFITLPPHTEGRLTQRQIPLTPTPKLFFSATPESRPLVINNLLTQNGFLLVLYLGTLKQMAGPHP